MEKIGPYPSSFPLQCFVRYFPHPASSSESAACGRVFVKQCKVDVGTQRTYLDLLANKVFLLGKNSPAMYIGYQRNVNSTCMWALFAWNDLMANETWFVSFQAQCVCRSCGKVSSSGCFCFAAK